MSLRIDEAHRADGRVSAEYIQQTFLRSGRSPHCFTGVHSRGSPMGSCSHAFCAGFTLCGVFTQGGVVLLEARDPDLAASRRYKPLSGSQTHPSRVVYVRELRSPGSVCCTVALGKVDSAWYGTHPSIVSPSLTGVFIGGGRFRHIANRVQDRGARC